LKSLLLAVVWETVICLKCDVRVFPSDKFTIAESALNYITQSGGRIQPLIPPLGDSPLAFPVFTGPP
ncbi:MAG: hypothetical protein AB8B36_12945, partial [Prochlorococcus sp.]